MIHNFIDRFGMQLHGGREESDSSLEETVAREVKEETNLDVKKMKFLNWIFKYKSLGKECTEYVYFSIVKKQKIKLNEESIDYRWCNIDEFIKLIEWEGNKEELRNVLEYAMNGKLFFLQPKIEN